MAFFVYLREIELDLMACAYFLQLTIMTLGCSSKLVFFFGTLYVFSGRGKRVNVISKDYSEMFYQIILRTLTGLFYQLS